MAKRFINSDINLKTIKMANLSKLIDPWELSILLGQEGNSSESDIMFQNMLEYYEETEEYEYCVVLRDEIKKRA